MYHPGVSWAWLTDAPVPPSVVLCVSVVWWRQNAFYVCRVCIQDQRFNNFENDTVKLSANEVAFHADDLRGSSRVPAPRDERLRTSAWEATSEAKLVCAPRTVLLFNSF